MEPGREARGQDGRKRYGGHARDEHRVADHLRRCTRAGTAAEVYAQVAVLVLVPAIAQTVRSVERGIKG